jgi:hypothetical protein
MTKTQANTLLALDACLVAMQDKLHQIKTKDQKNELVLSAIKEGEKAERLIDKLAEIIR